MMKKIVLGACILFLLMGVVCATDINDFKMPNNFKVGNKYYASNGDFGISFNQYNDSNYDHYFTNNSDYTVSTSNNITNYSGEIGVGCDEVVEINGERFVIESYYTGNEVSKLNGCYDNLLEFNRLNNLNPIEIVE